MTRHAKNACYVISVLTPIDGLARCLSIGALLDAMTRRFGGYEVVAHWTPGDLHHDIVVMLPASATADLPGRVLVVATNADGGIKEILCFAEVPDRAALWHHRRPDALELSGDVLPILGRAKGAWDRDEPPTQRSR